MTEPTGLVMSSHCGVFHDLRNVRGRFMLSVVIRPAACTPRTGGTRDRAVLGQVLALHRLGRANGELCRLKTRLFGLIRRRCRAGTAPATRLGCLVGGQLVVVRDAYRSMAATLR